MVPALALRRSRAPEGAVGLALRAHERDADTAHEHAGDQATPLSGRAAERMACTVIVLSGLSLTRMAVRELLGTARQIDEAIVAASATGSTATAGVVTSS